MTPLHETTLYGITFRYRYTPPVHPDLTGRLEDQHPGEPASVDIQQALLGSADVTDFLNDHGDWPSIEEALLAEHSD